IVFIPACIVPSYGNCTWSELLEFTTRQIIITRVYMPQIWRLTFLMQTTFNIVFWWAAVLARDQMLAAMIVSLIYLLGAITAFKRLQAVATVLPESSLSNYRWSYILLFPLSALLYQYNLIRSAFTRDITWRQIRYSLLSPHRTVVHRVAGN